MKTTYKEPHWMKEIRSSHSIEMIANVPHAAVIHEGRTPGARGPGSDHLKEWCRRVLNDESLAFVVARAIHERGFNPAFHNGDKAAKYFWKPLFEDHEKWLKHFMDRVPIDGVWAAQQQIAGEWQSEARWILGTGNGGGRWFDKGTLSDSFEVRVE